MPTGRRNRNHHHPYVIKIVYDGYESDPYRGTKICFSAYWFEHSFDQMLVYVTQRPEAGKTPKMIDAVKVLPGAKWDKIPVDPNWPLGISVTSIFTSDGNTFLTPQEIRKMVPSFEPWEKSFVEISGDQFRALLGMLEQKKKAVG
jgi:hypothetical protein